MDVPIELERVYRRLRRYGLFWWIVNLMLFALPFTVIVLINDLANVILNMFMNNFWAEGNIFLMGNTFFLFC